MKTIRTAKQVSHLLLVLFFFCWQTAFANGPMAAHPHAKYPDNAPLVVSLSSDGDYAISSHLNGEIVLWDIKQQQANIIAKHANIYSAYFIKHTPYFMWQDDQTNIVHIQDVDGKAVKQFQVDYPTYGQVITSDLKNYFASDENWNLYKGYGKDQQLIKSACDLNGFLGAGKLINLTLSSDDRYLLTSGADYPRDHDKKVPLAEDIKANQLCIRLSQDPSRPKLHKLLRSPFENVTLWNVKTGQPIHNFTDNAISTFATFSPNKKFVVSGDENAKNFIWDTPTGKRLVNLQHHVGTCWAIGCSASFYGGEAGHFDNRGFPPLPKDYHDYNNSISDRIVSVKFIDQDNYLRFNYYMPFAVLYNVHDPKPKAFLRLGKDPMPNVTSYLYDENIDTAPAAHRLVMGQAGHGSGIIVYQYDPDKQTLTKVWAPEGPKVYQGFKGWVQRQYDRLKGDWRWESA